MTPERAAELARDALKLQDVKIGLSLNDCINRAILQACNEQREIDANICDDLVNTNMDGSIRDGISQVRVESSFATAILRAGK